MSNQRNVTFQDNDPAFKYIATTDWRVAAWDGIYDGTNGTFHLSDTIGTQFTFTFPTPGVAMYYFGLRRSDGAFYQACVDCDPVNPSFDKIDAVNTTDDGHNSPVVLYQRTFNTPGIHTLIVQNLQDVRFGRSEINVDRVVITVQDGDASTPLSSSSSSTASATGSGSMTQGESGIDKKKSNPIGAIVGGVVGGVVLLVLAALLLWWRHRRQKASSARSRRKTLIDGPPSPPPVQQMHEHGAYHNVTPYSVAGVTNPTTSDPGHHRLPSSSSTHIRLPSNSSAPDLVGGASVSSPVSLSPIVGTSSIQGSSTRRLSTVKRPRGATGRTRSGSMPHVSEVDAGPVVLTEEGRVTVPPPYDQIFGSHERNSEEV